MLTGWPRAQIWRQAVRFHQFQEITRAPCVQMIRKLENTVEHTKRKSRRTAKCARREQCRDQNANGRTSVRWSRREKGRERETVRARCEQMGKLVTRLFGCCCHAFLSCGALEALISMNRVRPHSMYPMCVRVKTVSNCQRGRQWKFLISANDGGSKMLSFWQMGQWKGRRFCFPKGKDIHKGSWLATKTDMSE